METIEAQNFELKIITTHELKSYEKILFMTNANLTDYQPDGNMHITRGA